jgi:hypothetical protein
MVIVLSLMGIVIARAFGGDVASSTTLVHSSATVVLLVTILARLESGKAKE